MQIKSPITNTYNTVLEEQLISELIISAYKKDYNIDVSKYFEEIDSVKIYKCLDTGYRFYFPFSLAGNSNLYEELQKQKGYYNLNLEHQLAETFFNTDDSVLEIGCGSGHFLQKLQGRGIACTGLEFNEDAVKAGQNIGVNILNQDIRTHSNENPKTYDIVCYFQVLEHVTQVHDFIQASLDALRPGGKLIVGVPNNNPFLYRYEKYHTLNLPPHHMGLWSKESLKNLTNFFSIQLETIITEPLQEKDIEHYFKLQIQQLKTKSNLFIRIAEFLFFQLCPTKIIQKLQKTISRFVQGRNILAVYTKL